MTDNQQSAPLSGSRNNSGDGVAVRPWTPEDAATPLSSYGCKQECALEHNIRESIRTYGVDRFVVLTLTFKDNIQDPKEMSRRINNARRLFKKHFVGWITVKERQRSGRWHLHMLCLCRDDVGAGFYADYYGAAHKNDSNLLLHQFILERPPKSPTSLNGGTRGILSGRELAKSYMRVAAYSCSPLLREIILDFKKRLPGLHFGRFELTPVLSTEDAIARYFTKQFRQANGARRPEDKGVRLVFCSKDLRFAKTSFAWVKSGRLWRRGVACLVKVLQHYGVPVEDFGDLAVFLGPRWAYHLRDEIPLLPEYGLNLPDWVASKIVRFLPWEYRNLRLTAPIATEARVEI